MRFRLKAFGLHLLISASVLGLVLGTLYLGWYRWPGWYVVGVSSVVAVLIGVDVTLGPLMTFLVARQSKPRAELVRDIGIIAAVQLAALLYGTVSLWSGRPLYYAFSTSILQLVQGYDFSEHALDVARDRHAALTPHWYSLPRWIWAPLPQDPQEAEKIIMDLTTGGGDDVTSMPQYFKPWEQGLPALRSQLKSVEDVPYFSKAQKTALEQRMRVLGLDPKQLNAMPLTGRGGTLLVVFDPAKLKIVAMLAPPDLQRHQPYLALVEGYWKSLLPRPLLAHPKKSHS